MKQLLFTAVLFLGAFAYGQDTTFSRIYEPTIGTLSYNYVPVTDADVVWDEGLITSGITAFERRTFLARIDSNGNLLWQNQFGANWADNDMEVNEVITTSDSNFVVVGKLRDSISGDFYPFCMKLDGSGDTLWTKSFDITNQAVGDFGLEQERNGHVIETKDSMILVGFHHLSYSLSTSDPDQFCLVKMTSNGDVLWSKSYFALNEFQLTGIQQALDSSIYMVGRGRGSQIDGYLINLSESGQINWTKRYNGVELMDIEIDSSGLYLGWANYSSQSGVMKVSLNGDQIRRVVHYLPISGDLPEVSITRRSNGNILSCPEAPPFDNFFGGFVEMDDSLNQVSSHEVYMMMDQLLSIPNKGVYAIGFGPLYGIKAGDEEMGVIRFDSLMNVPDCAYSTTMGISEEADLTTGTPLFSVSLIDSVAILSLPIQYEPRDFISEDGCVTFLGSVDEIEGTWNETVSPNPSLGQFKIDWYEYRNAEVVIFNAIGKEVFRSNAQNSFIEIDLQAEQDGVYYYRLVDENGSRSNGKLILMR